MHRLVFYWLTATVISQLHCRAQSPCIQEEYFLKPNRSIEFDLSNKRNQTGHWMSNLSVHKVAPKLPNNFKVKLKQHVTEYAGTESMHVNAMVIVPPPRPADYELFPGIGYYKFHTDNAANFDDALIQCAKEGGHLAIINSEEESQVLQNIFARFPTGNKVKTDIAFIGFHDRYKEGEFLTVFGEPLNSTGFIKWSYVKNPDGGTTENCGSIHRNGGLNDIGCNKLIPYFCEFDLIWESP